MDEEQQKRQVLAAEFGEALSDLSEQFMKRGLPLNTQAKILMGGALDCHEAFMGSLLMQSLQEMGKRMDERYVRRE